MTGLLVTALAGALAGCSLHLDGDPDPDPGPKAEVDAGIGELCFQPGTFTEHVPAPSATLQLLIDACLGDDTQCATVCFELLPRWDNTATRVDSCKVHPVEDGYVVFGGYASPTGAPGCPDQP